MRKYDQEFKKEVVKKYLDGQSVASIAREIGVNENTKVNPKVKTANLLI